MNKLALLILIFIFILSQGCTGPLPQKEEFIGKWVSSDGATFFFKEDGTFIGEKLPAIFFTFYTDEKDVVSKRVKGKGDWTIRSNQGYWEIKLKFLEMDGENVDMGNSILISGTKGILENQPPWYIFEWEGEEGGKRYKFEKR